MEALAGRYVAVGSETGPGARPCHVDWIRSVVQQCAQTNVRCHVKQFGPRPLVTEQGLEEWGHWKRTDDPDLYQPIMDSRGGSDPDEWPEDLRVRELPATEGRTVNG